jgi:hypothetical protein
MTSYCAEDLGRPGKSETRIPIEKGKLTRLFDAAGVHLEKGKVIDGMTVVHCTALGKYMKNNPEAWVEPGKDPSREARGMFTILKRGARVTRERQARLSTCEDIVLKSVASVSQRRQA